MVRTIQYEDPNKNGIGKKGLRELKGDENGPTVVPRNESGVAQSAGTATDPVNVTITEAIEPLPAPVNVKPNVAPVMVPALLSVRVLPAFAPMVLALPKLTKPA